MQNAADKMARELLGMATDPDVSDSVKITAIRDALDRAGLKPVTAVDLDISTKPWEAVFEGISTVVAGPRYPETTTAIEGENTPAIEPDDEIVGEFDDDPLPEDDEIEPDPSRIQHDRESESDAVIDVKIVADEYTDEIMSGGIGTTTPDQDQTDLSVDPGFTPGPLGLGGPAGSGLMTLSDAIEAASVMRRREAARLRDMRRR